MDLDNIKKVHFVGIGGIGVSAIAKLMLANNKEVSGSDMAKSEITDELEKRSIKFFNNCQAENVADDIDLLIYSLAVPENNPERVKAKELGIKELSYPQFLGEFSKDKYTIAVSGADGKSTTTAMIGLILEKAGLDPTVILGTKVKSFKDGNLRLGQSKYLVVEACEYGKAMMEIEPSIIVITNIRPEHLDTYGNSFDNLKKTFREYINKLPEDGILIVNNDDEVSSQLNFKNKLTYGFNSADVKAINHKVVDQTQLFDIKYKDKDLGEFKLVVPGQFNVSNALAALAAGLVLDIKPDDFKIVLAGFVDLWRRFEKVGEREGVPIISDFGHTPEAIQGTIQGAKEFYPEKRIVVAFQPHHHDRTKRFFKEFIESFDLVDLLIVNEIYDVEGREEDKDQDISSKDLVREIAKRGKEVIYSPNLEETKKLVLENIKKGDLILIIGAGDIYQITEDLVKKSPTD